MTDHARNDRIVWRLMIGAAILIVAALFAAGFFVGLMV